MTRLVLLAALAACKSKEPPRAAPPETAPAAPDAAAPAADWTARCEAALAAAPKLTPVRRIQAILDGCRPCGDWTPLLRWNTAAADGGPRTAELEAVMTACGAYCKPQAETLFLGTLEAARGKRSTKPWRELGKVCGEAVSAQGDARHMSAPLFALDRIARRAAADRKLAPLLAAIELPLPPLSSTGGAVELPASPAITPDAGPVQITVSASELAAGTLPRAKLGPAGVAVHAGDVPYPGAAVAPEALAAALDRLSPGPDARIAVIAPRAMAARRVLDVVAAAGAHRLVLAAAAAGAPEGWTLPGVVPVVLSAAAPAAAAGAAPAAPALRLTLGASADDAIRELKDAPAGRLAAPPAIVLDDAATVEGLAKLLGALAYRDVRAASLGRARP